MNLSATLAKSGPVDFPSEKCNSVHFNNFRFEFVTLTNFGFTEARKRYDQSRLRNVLGQLGI